MHFLGILKTRYDGVLIDIASGVCEYEARLCKKQHSVAIGHWPGQEWGRDCVENLEIETSTRATFFQDGVCSYLFNSYSLKPSAKCRAKTGSKSSVIIA